MADPANETVRYPFTTFNFAVEIRLPGQSGTLCSASFSDCDGLEMTMEVKTIREGGNNGKQLRLAGPVGYGQLTLKRGMTASFDLWDWFAAVMTNARLRADVTVVVFAADGKTERARFVLTRCLPIKLKAPALNAKDGMVAIEEMQIAYESLSMKPPEGSSSSAGPAAPAGALVNLSVGVSASASAEISIG